MMRTDLAYRMTAAEGDGGIGLLIALFDTLAGDLRRAAIAEQAGDIQARCNETRHALLVIGCLEEAAARGSEGALARKLALFYRLLRRRIVEAQAKRSAQLLESAMTEVLKVREMWQGIAESAPPAAAQPAPMAPYHGASDMRAEHPETTWAA